MALKAGFLVKRGVVAGAAREMEEEEGEGGGGGRARCWRFGSIRCLKSFAPDDGAGAAQVALHGKMGAADPLFLCG